MNPQGLKSHWEALKVLDQSSLGVGVCLLVVFKESPCIMDKQTHETQKNQKL